MAFSPKTYMHDVHPLNQWVAIKTRREQMGQLRQRFQILWMIVTRFDPRTSGSAGEFAAAVSTHWANLHQRNAGAQKPWQRKLLGLKHGVRRLNAEGDSQPMAP